MRAAQERNRQGIPVPDRSWKLSDWLDYWPRKAVLISDVEPQWMGARLFGESLKPNQRSCYSNHVERISR